MTFPFSNTPGAVHIFSASILDFFRPRAKLHSITLLQRLDSALDLAFTPKSHTRWNRYLLLSLGQPNLLYDVVDLRIHKIKNPLSLGQKNQSLITTHTISQAYIHEHSRSYQQHHQLRQLLLLNNHDSFSASTPKHQRPNKPNHQQQHAFFLPDPWRLSRPPSFSPAPTHCFLPLKPIFCPFACIRSRHIASHIFLCLSLIHERPLQQPCILFLNLLHRPQELHPPQPQHYGVGD